jgi:hypothetical protein
MIPSTLFSSPGNIAGGIAPPWLGKDADRRLELLVGRTRGAAPGRQG